MLGLMQDWPLTLDKLLDHAAEWHGGREIVTRSIEGPIVRTTYADIRRRAKRLSNALKSLGVKTGDRVATLAWNSGRHMEAWYAIMGIGAVCHTLNPLLFPDRQGAGLVAGPRSQPNLVEDVVAGFSSLGSC